MSSCTGHESFVDMDDSNKGILERITNSNVWKIYGLIGVLIVLYSTNIIIKSKPEYVKKLWIAYIILAAVLGFMGN